MKYLVLISLTLLIICSYAETTSDISLQNININKFLEIFKNQYLSNSSGSAFKIFSELKTHISKAGGTSVSSVNDKIKVLESAFTDDQGRDDQYYEKRIKQLNDELEEANIKLQELQRREAFIKKKFEIIKLEENNIQTLHDSDKEKYLARYGQQQAMINILTQLLDKVKTELLDNPTIPDKSPEKVFAELRKIGKGNPIAALLQYTKLFTKEDAQKVYDLFNKLKGALEASIKIDEEKEQKNDELYDELLKQIEIVVPKAEQELEDVGSDINAQENYISEVEATIEKVKKQYADRKSYRDDALTNVAEARKLLIDNMKELVDWEALVNANQAPTDETPVQQGASTTTQGASTTQAATTTQGASTTTQAASTQGAATTTTQAASTQGATTTTTQAATTQGAATTTTQAASTQGAATTTTQAASTQGATTTTTQAASTQGAATTTTQAASTQGAATTTTQAASTQGAATTTTQAASTQGATTGTQGASTQGATTGTQGASTQAATTTTTQAATTTQGGAL